MSKTYVVKRVGRRAPTAVHAAGRYVRTFPCVLDLESADVEKLRQLRFSVIPLRGQTAEPEVSTPAAQATPPELDLESMTVAQLRELMDERGLPKAPKDTRKAELIEAIRG